MDFIFLQRPLEVYEEFIEQVNKIYKDFKKCDDLIQQLQSIEAEFFQQNLPEIQIYKLFLIVFVNFEKTQDEGQINRSIHQFFEGKHQRVNLILKFFFKVFQYFDIVNKDHHIIFIVIFENFIPLIEHDNSFFQLVIEFLTNYLSYQSEFCYSQKIQNILCQKLYQSSISNQNLKNIVIAKIFQILLFHSIKDKNPFQDERFKIILEDQQSINYFKQLGGEAFFFLKLIQDKINFSSIFTNLQEVNLKQDQYQCLMFYKLLMPVKIQQFVIFLFQKGTQESYSYQMSWFQKQILECIKDFDYHFYIFLISVTHETQIQPWVLIMQIVQIVFQCGQKNLYSLVKEATFLDWLFYDHKNELHKQLVKIGFDTVIQMNQYSLQLQSNELLEFLFVFMQQYEISDKITDVFVYLEYLNYNLQYIIQNLNINEEIRQELNDTLVKLQKKQNFFNKEDIFEDQKVKQIDSFEEESFDESVDQIQDKIQIEVLNFHTSRQDLQVYMTPQDFSILVVQGKSNNELLQCLSNSIISDFYGFEEFEVKKVKELLIYQLYQLNVRIGQIDKCYQQKFTQIIKVLLKNKEIIQICLLIFIFNYKSEKEKSISSLQKSTIKVNKKYISQNLLNNVIGFLIQKIEKHLHLKYALILLKLIKNFNLTQHYFFVISFCFQCSKYSQDLLDIEEMTRYFIKKIEELNFQENEQKFKIYCLVFFENDMLFPSENFDEQFKKIILYINKNPKFLQNNSMMFTKGLKYIQNNLNQIQKQNCLKHMFELQQENFWFFQIISNIFQKSEIIHLIKSKSKIIQKEQKEVYLEILSHNINFSEEERELLLQDSI